MIGDRPLDDDEAALVFRRASELDVELAAGRSVGWDVDRLVEVGREVGISPDAVRRAAAEVRLGDPAVELGEPLVRTIRIVPAAPDAAQAALTAWLREQLLEAVRDRPGYVLAERREDEEAKRRRRRDDARRYRLGAARRVALAVAGVPGGGSAVRIEVELAWTTWRQTVSGWPYWVAALGAIGVADLVGEPHWLVRSAIVVAGVVTGRARVDRRAAADAAEVRLAVEGAIDRLER